LAVRYAHQPRQKHVQMRLIDTIPKQKLAEMMKESTKKGLIAIILDLQYEVNMLKSKIEAIENQSAT